MSSQAGMGVRYEVKLPASSAALLSVPLSKARGRARLSQRLQELG